jgi:outer membrane biosynthesis protein TonB
MIKITIEVKDGAEAATILNKIYGKHAETVDETVPAVEVETPAEDTQVVDSDQENEQEQPVVDKKPASKKKRSKKKTSSKNKDNPYVGEQAPADNSDTTPTKDDVRKALADVGAANGFRAASAICQEFKATGLRDLDEKYYAEVITRCQETLND